MDLWLSKRKYIEMLFRRNVGDTPYHKMYNADLTVKV